MALLGPSAPALTLNSPPILLIRNGSRYFVHLSGERNGQGYHGIFYVGAVSASPLAVRLVGPEIAGRHARYYGRGHHQYLELLDEAELRCFRERYGRYIEDNSLRVDRGPFTLGPYTLTFGSRRDSSPEAPR